MSDAELLWDRADELSCQSGKAPEWHWVQMMHDFWLGRFAPNGLVLFSKPIDGPGRASETLDRETLAAQLIPVRRTTPSRISPEIWTYASPIESLADWTISDYAAIEPAIAKWFARDPGGSTGLAVERSAFDLWLEICASGKSKVLAQQVPVRPRISNAELEAWVRVEIGTAATAKMSFSANELWERAKVTFGPRVTRAQVRDLYSKGAPPDWQKQGRRKRHVR